MPNLSRRRMVAALALAPGAASAAGPLLGPTPVLAQDPDDQVVAALRTAISVENVLVGLYRTVLDLSFIRQPDDAQRLRALLVLWRDHHRQHAEALNRLVVARGGPAQSRSNAALANQITAGLARVEGTGSTLALAADIEDACGQTHQANLSRLDGPARELTASILGVESQHSAMLRLAALLAADGAIGLLDPTADLGGYPVGSVGDTVASPRQALDLARPPDEGITQ